MNDKGNDFINSGCIFITNDQTSDDKGGISLIVGVISGEPAGPAPTLMMVLAFRVNPQTRTTL